MHIFERRPHMNAAFWVDVIVALAVAAAFTLFAITVMQMDSSAGNHMVFPPGRTVYM